MIGQVCSVEKVSEIREKVGVFEDCIAPAAIPLEDIFVRRAPSADVEFRVGALGSPLARGESG
jgi:hypothetical protein